MAKQVEVSGTSAAACCAREGLEKSFPGSVILPLVYTRRMNKDDEGTTTLHALIEQVESGQTAFRVAIAEAEPASTGIRHYHCTIHKGTPRTSVLDVLKKFQAIREENRHNLVAERVCEELTQIAVQHAKRKIEQKFQRR